MFAQQRGCVWAGYLKHRGYPRDRVVLPRPDVTRVQTTVLHLFERLLTPDVSERLLVQHQILVYIRTGHGIHGIIRGVVVIVARVRVAHHAGRSRAVVHDEVSRATRQRIGTAFPFPFREPQI